MWSTQNREELPVAIQKEIEDLVIRIKRLMTQEHDDEGKHEGANYDGTVSGIGHITIVNGIVTEVS